MTAKRKTPEAMHVEYVRSSGNNDGPSFGTFWKWLVGIASIVTGAALIGGFTWMWNMQDSMTKLSGAVVVNADSVKSLASLLDRLQQSDASQAATLATVQVQQSNSQTNASNANITLSARIERIESSLAARIDSMEREARWRANQQQSGRR